MLAYRSPEWYKAREGKFTSSRISDLMGIKGLGKTGETYAFELAVEIVFGYDYEDGYESYDMRVGIEREPLAFEQFREDKAGEFLEVEECGFIILNENLGSSPDGKVSDNSGLEIKCPKANKFFRIVADGIEALDKEWVLQAQHQMYVCGFKQVYFVVYTIYNGNPYSHEIIIPRDNEVISLMEKRTAEAIVIRDNYVEKLRLNLPC